MVQLLSVRELRNLSPDALSTHMLDLCLAKVKVTTDSEREDIDRQLQRVYSLMNEKAMLGVCR